MKKIKLAIFLFLLFFSLQSCGNSVEKDAKKAAEISVECLALTRERNLKEAQEKYSKLQEIMDKYRQQPEEQEFYNTYSSYLQGNEKEE